ncbi:Wzz/FepE/Etk N-terminal domain-containing protein [Kineococcus rhizosphaerae]|uniref:Subunit length determinant protein n=1 Tax=Kineococcus rhizosphaerae TaxID=559628 RepID=A0A2T0R5H7_9ACTN|nr:Wzz/FepE/Etk N-terminal domain-containing protein [Kineococcus rhizosphaerae]PRY16023.1 subunit length determinant protein [Kineococcus rhizosphaerae]
MAATTMGTTERSGPGAWAAVFRHRWKVLVVAVVMAVAGYLGAANLIPPVYTATTTITLSKDRPFDATATGNNGAQLGDPTQWAALQAAVVQSSAVLEAATAPVATGTGTGTVQVPAADADTFRDGLTVTAKTDTNQITVTSSASRAQDAADTADAVAYAYRALAAQGVTAARDAALANVERTDTATIQQINLAATTYGSGVASIDAAFVPTTAAAPYPWQIALVAGIVGLLAAAGAVAWAAHLKQRVTAPPLGGVAELARWNTLPSFRSLSDPLSEPSRSTGVVLVGLQHLGHLRTPRLEVSSVLVTAASGNAGALALGLAASAARSGRRVVMVDADESGSRLAMFGAPVAEAAASVPQGRWSEEIRPWVVGGGAVVGVLPLDARALQPHAVGSGVRHLVEAGYLVIFVGGSVVSSPVAFAVAGEVDAVLVQVEADPRAEVVSKTLAQLSIAAPDVVAQVVVGDTSSSGGGENHRLEQRSRPAGGTPQPSPEVAGRRG